MCNNQRFTKTTRSGAKLIDVKIKKLSLVNITSISNLLYNISRKTRYVEKQRSVISFSDKVCEALRNIFHYITTRCCYAPIQLNNPVYLRNECLPCPAIFLIEGLSILLLQVSLLHLLSNQIYHHHLQDQTPGIYLELIKMLWDLQILTNSRYIPGV